MKLLSTTLFLLSFSFYCFAQDKPLSVDEQGRLIYYEVVTDTKTPTDSLMSRAKAFLETDKSKYKLAAFGTDTSLKATGKLMISKSALGMARPMGAVDYNFFVEVKEGKYRFWFTDFVFIPYSRDRYGNFVATTTIGIPLEREQGKLRAAEWLGYQKITAREAKAVADQFKIAMATRLYGAEAPKPTNTISTKKW
jgi:hypothetical protein